MKVLFSVPVLSDLAEMPLPMPDLGLIHLAAEVKEHGHTVDLLDWGMSSGPDHYQAFLQKNLPGMVAIKVFTKDLMSTHETIELIKSVDTRIKVVIGGPHPSVVPADELMEDLPGADFAFQGEADRGLPQLVDQIAASEKPLDLSSIPGLVWRDQQGQIRANRRMFIKEIDTLNTLPYELIDFAQYPFCREAVGRRRNCYAVPFLTSRGCPKNCTFCSVKFINSQQVRYRSIGKIQSEITLLYHKYRVRYLAIMDNGFSIDPQFVENFCRMMISKKFDMNWDCVLVNIGDFLDPAMARLMKQAGCDSINVGIESGSPRIRELINKHETLDQIRQLVNNFNQQGIGVFGYFMFGFPTETRQEMQQTIDLCRSLPLARTDFHLCFPTPGTEIFEYVRKKYSLTTIDWKNFDVYTSPYSAAEIPSSQIHSLAKKAMSRFLLNKGYLVLLKKLYKRVFKFK